jgi:hypothetical protein
MAKKHKKHSKNKKKKSKKEQRVEISKDILQKISNLKKKFSNHPSDELALEFYKIFRDFFSGFFNLKFKFTYEELSDQIEHKRIDPRYKRRIEKLAKRLTYLEYSKIDVTNKLLREMINDFKYIVKKLTASKKKKKHVNKRLDRVLKKIAKKSRLFKRLRLKKVKKPGKKPLLKKVFVKRDKEAEFHEEEKMIHELLKKAFDALVNRNAEKAKNIYAVIMELYQKLPSEDKERVHNDILKVFKPKPKTDVNKLIEKTYYYMGKRDVENTGRTYTQLESVYKEMSEKEKEIYYPKIAELYENIKIIFA